MKINQIITKPYYHTPAWLTMIIENLRQNKCVTMLKQSEYAETTGLYRFRASYGEESGREEVLYVWTTTAEKVHEHLRLYLGDKLSLLKLMAEEYAAERKGREETRVYRCIVELIIARATELFNATQPNETLVITGNFSMVGRLPENGRLRINGTVERVEDSVGQLLEVASERCPEIPRGLTAELKEKVWHIRKEEPWHEAPITGICF